MQLHFITSHQVTAHHMRAHYLTLLGMPVHTTYYYNQIKRQDMTLTTQPHLTSPHNQPRDIAFHITTQYIKIGLRATETQPRAHICHATLY